MRLAALVVVALAFFGVCNALLTAYPMLSSKRWKAEAPVDKGRNLCFHLALKHNPAQRAAFDRRFFEVSNPNSKLYGQHLSMDQITDLLGPSQSHVDEITQWLKTVPLTSLDTVANRDWIKSCMPASSAEHLMGSPFYTFSHSWSSKKAVRAHKPLIVPPHIAAKLDFIGGANTPIHNYQAQRVKSAMDMKHADGKQSKTVAATPQKPHDPRDDAESDIAPVLGLVVAGNLELAAHFTLRCHDGTINQDVTPNAPCSSRGNAVSEFAVLLSATGHGDRLVSIPATICAGSTCVATIDAVRNYVPLSLRVMAKYADGSTSGYSKRSFMLYATDYATPLFLKQLYDIPSQLAVKNKKSTQSVAEFLEQYYSTKDLAEYLSLMGVPLTKVERLIGPNNETEGSISGGESQLDIQVIMGVAINAPTWFWSIPGRQEHTHQEPFLEWAMAIANTSDAPLVHSVSYADDEASYEPEYMHRLDVEFMKMGLRGMTVVVASGDDGVGSGDSRPENLAKASRLDCGRSNPEYPSASPFVLSVGGTQLTDQPSSICLRSTHGLHTSCSNKAEKGCSSGTGGVITSGGGFSNTFPMPDYQKEAVARYLALEDVTLPPVHFFNRSGRGYPDVSAYSSNYITIMGGEVSLSSGTSASTPLIAAMVVFWNDVLMSSGRPPVGFVNPLLYKIAAEHPEAFNDVVTGDNKCGIYGLDCCDHGFEAKPGWDPITGLGSPRFPVIANLLLNPQNPYPWVNGVPLVEPPTFLGVPSSGVYTTSLVVSLLSLFLSAYLVWRFSNLARIGGERTPLLGKD